MPGLEGKTLDRYELRQLTGKGGMADVYLGYDPRFQRDVAIKVFKRDDEEMLRRFIREARLMAKLQHPHLMPIYDTGESTIDGAILYYIVMPFMESGTLRTLIRRAPLSLKQICRYLTDIGSALDYIHAQGIIHRDIKASNVLLSADGRCFLSDFGIARTTSDATQLTSTGNVLGTVEYVAPELFESDGKANALSDLYSLGVLLFEMATGKLPFTSENQIALVAMHVNKQPPSPSSIVANIPPQVEYVMLKVLEKKPELRYRNATELAEAFCQATQSNSEGRVPLQSSAISSLETTEFDRPLVLAPPPAVTPAASSVPLVRSSGEYSAFSGSPQTPAYQNYRPQSTRVQRYSSPARTRTVVVTVMALVVLLAVVVPVFFAAIYAGSTAKNAAATIKAMTETAQAASATAGQQAQNATVTAAQQAQNATATAIAGTDATAQAHAMATAGVIQTATAGNPSYTDSLLLNDLANKNWDQNNNCKFLADGYHVTATVNSLGPLGKESASCRNTTSIFSNMAVVVDMKIVTGQSGGVFFRAKTAPVTGAFSGYLFEVASQGNYRISRLQNATLGFGVTVLKLGTIQTGWQAGKNVDNTLQIRAVGRSLSFYVNNFFVATLQDGNLSSGNIAFLATAANSAVYTNLKVFTLP